MTTSSRTILHADMDAFYASVEQLDHPELRGKPIIVGSDSRRGVVTTASYEARPFGVRSAMPSMQAKKLCPDCLFVRPRMKRYAEVAKQVRAVFEEVTPLVESISLDEAFLDITGSLKLFGDPWTIGRRLKDRMLEATGLVVSVGIGPTKMVAKIASDLCKPDGLAVIAPDEVFDFLRPLPVARLWGVGPATLDRLAPLGVRTIGDAASVDPKLLARELGSLGPHIVALARGEDARQVSPDRERKSYGEERTFDRDYADGPEIRALLRTASDDVARRLRADGRRARVVVLKFKLTTRIGPGKYPILTRRQALDRATDDGPTIAKVALALWAESHQGRKVRLAGVSVTEIEEDTAAQLALFDDDTRRRQSAINHALDALTERFGQRVIHRGATHRPRSESR